MSENMPGALRVMIIDVAEDKLVLDEFCDCIIGGVATSKKGNCLLAAKSDIVAGVIAVGACEKAIEMHKKATVQSFMKKIGVDNMDQVIDEIITGGNDDGAET